MAARPIPDGAAASGRVLVGDSVFEPAHLTVADGRLYVEFDDSDLDNITIDLRTLAAER